jgi:mannose/fructose/N-acetylgalactosamine-specific phosphotransferase system component IIC
MIGVEVSDSRCVQALSFVHYLRPIVAVGIQLCMGNIKTGLIVGAALTNTR